MAGIHGIEAGRAVLAYRQITVLTSAVGCPLASQGKAVMFKAEAQEIRYRLDGIAPTASVGIPVAAGECVWFVGDLTKLQFIEVAAGGILNLHIFE